MIYNLLIGGTQGDGLASLGQILIGVFGRLGYHTQSERSFASRIKGGHTYTHITLSDAPVHSVHHPYHLIIALDEKTLTAYEKDAHPQVAVLTTLKGTHHPTLDLTAYDAPSRYHNILLLGYVAAFLGLPRKNLDHFIEERFSKKGQEVVEENLHYFHQVFKKSPKGPVPAFSQKEKPLVALTGNELFAMGALASGCRFHAAYPITPASEILEYMARHLPHYGGLFVQTEDEIAAATMALGAAFSGTPAMTSTSGPGLSLMQETLGLAMVTETPLVVVDVQRVGPSTGLPTKTEQSDLLAALHGSHGDGSPIVLCPYDGPSLVRTAGEAFQLAGDYQHPVVVLSDLTLGLSVTTMPLEDIPLDEVTYPERKTRATTGLEHDDTGHVSNDPLVRQSGAQHRLAKLQPLLEKKGIDFLGHSSSRHLILTCGSFYGLLADHFADRFHIGMITRLHPLDVRTLRGLDGHYDQIFVLEMNSTGQLVGLLRPYFKKTPLISLISYDGQMPRPESIGGFFNEHL